MTSVPLIRGTRDALRYGFAVGKVRVLQSRVFGGSTYERLLDAPDFGEQRRVLSDTLYGRYLEGVRDSDGVERALEQALDDAYRFVDEANLPESVRRFFRVRYDWANVKAKLKADATGADLGAMLETLGTLPPETFEGSAADLPEPFRSTYERLRPAEEEGGVETVDEEVDRAMFADLGRLAKESGSAFLRQLAALMVDVANLKVLARARLAGTAAERMAGMLMDGGSLRRSELEAVYESPEDLRMLVSRAPTLRGLAVEELEDPQRLDVVAEDLVVRFVRKNRAAAVGPEPVIAYVLAREAEVTMVRMLLVGKLAGVPSETLRARLREMYV